MKRNLSDRSKRIVILGLILAMVFRSVPAYAFELSSSVAWIDDESWYKIDNDLVGATKEVQEKAIKHLAFRQKEFDSLANKEDKLAYFYDFLFGHYDYVEYFQRTPGNNPEILYKSADVLDHMEKSLLSLGYGYDNLLLDANGIPTDKKQHMINMVRIEDGYTWWHETIQERTNRLTGYYNSLVADNNIDGTAKTQLMRVCSNIINYIDFDHVFYNSVSYNVPENLKNQSVEAFAIPDGNGGYNVKLLSNTTNDIYDLNGNLIPY